MRDDHRYNYPQYRFPPSYPPPPSSRHISSLPSLSSSSSSPSPHHSSRPPFPPPRLYDGSPSSSSSSSVSSSPPSSLLSSSPHSPYQPSSGGGVEIGYSSSSSSSVSSSPPSSLLSSSPHTPYQHNNDYSRGTPYRLPERPPIDKKRQLKDIHLFERSLRERYRHAIKKRNRFIIFVLLLIIIDVIFALSLCLGTPPPFWDPLFWQNESHLNTWSPLVICIFFTGICIFQGYRAEYIRGPSLFLTRCNYFLENLNIRFSEKDCKLVIRNRG